MASHVARESFNDPPDTTERKVPPDAHLHVHGDHSCASWGSFNMAYSLPEGVSTQQSGLLPDGWLPSSAPDDAGSLSAAVEQQEIACEAGGLAEDTDSLAQNETLGVVQRHALSSTAHRERPACVPALRLHKVKSSSAGPLPRPLSETEAAIDPIEDAALCFEASVNRAVHSRAPLADNRCYIYRSMGTQELSRMTALLQRLPEAEAGEVARIWDALLVARRDCEAIASRGVRVARDVSRDWQETVSDLIDRVVAQDAEISSLRQQLKGSAHAQPHQLPPSPGHPSYDEVTQQLVRVKRQRDKLHQQNRELSVTLNDTQDLLRQSQVDAGRTQEALDQLRQKARVLREQQVSLLRHHMEVSAHAECLEAEVARLIAAAGGGQDKDSPRVRGGADVAAAAGARTIKLMSPRAILMGSPRGAAGSAGLSPLAQSARSPRAQSASRVGGIVAAAAAWHSKRATAGSPSQEQPPSPPPPPQQQQVSSGSSCAPASGGPATANAKPAGPGDPSGGAQQPSRSDSHEPDSRAEDQFDQQATAAPAGTAMTTSQQTSKPAGVSGKVLGGGAPQLQIGRLKTQEAADRFDYNADVEACKQQLDLLMGLAL